jgi:hypothetical protein
MNHLNSSDFAFRCFRDSKAVTLLLNQVGSSRFTACLAEMESVSLTSLTLRLPENWLPLLIVQAFH